MWNCQTLIWVEFFLIFGSFSINISFFHGRSFRIFNVRGNLMKNPRIQVFALSNIRCFTNGFWETVVFRTTNSGFFTENDSPKLRPCSDAVHGSLLYLNWIFSGIHLLDESRKCEKKNLVIEPNQLLWIYNTASRYVFIYYFQSISTLKYWKK